MTALTDLTAALRAHARGLHHSEAAVDLLIGHRTWLHRNDFLHHFVHTVNGMIDQTPMAPIDWPEAIHALDNRRLPCSGSEGRILRLAASIAQGIPIDLRDALTSLDRHNTELVCHAITQATGHSKMNDEEWGLKP